MFIQKPREKLNFIGMIFSLLEMAPEDKKSDTVSLGRISLYSFLSSHVPRDPLLLSRYFKLELHK